MNAGEFDLLLAVWAQGHKSPFWNTEKLHRDLLSCKVSNTRGNVESEFLYRAYIPNSQQIRSLNYRGFFVIETPSQMPLASWSSSLEEAIDFISAKEKWLIVKKPTHELNIFFALADSWKETKELDRHHNISWFNEVIVSMPDRLNVSEVDVVSTCRQLSYPAWQEVA